MLTSVTRTRSPLQRELDSLTKVLGVIAWGAVAVIVVAGLIRGTPADELLLLGTAMAISAIPTGMPAFVSGLLSMGAKQLAQARAVVKNLTDVETLGATSAINTDKTGTLTLNEMMVSTLYTGDAFHFDWAADTLDRVKALGARQLIGGRGAIARGRDEVDAAVEQTRDFLLTMHRTVGDAHRSGGTLKDAFAATHEALAPQYGAWPIFEHCLPFDVSRLWDEFSGIERPVIWTAERDRQVWDELQG